MPALDLVGIEMSLTSERARRNCTRARKPLAPRGVAELAPQYLSDRRFRQRIAKLDMSRNLVGGELQPAVLDDGFLCKLHVLAHNTTFTASPDLLSCTPITPHSSTP